MLTAAKNLSPFDVNMAYDAGWAACTPYTDVKLEEVRDLIQDTIFSRGPKGVSRTGVFIGGRDAHLAMDMMKTAKEAMVPPFEISLFADPSGAFTTAAGMTACVERYLMSNDGRGLEGKRVLVFGGTGPVGSTAAMMSSRVGADAIIISGQSQAKADSVCELCNQRYGIKMSGADGSNDDLIMQLVAQADVVFNAAKSGIQILNSRHLQVAEKLKVACDVNAVPPEGIEGVGVLDDAAPITDSPSGAVGIGALTVGNVKYHTQYLLLKKMYELDAPQYLDFNEAFEVARRYVG
ncbi:MAG: methylenetetrahydromethanopterin dehydrogenase [Gammaproteobacteria bacterium]|nr:methylenetetrahydromethanopterin dehydrogenase [Gammaproteobacteria bacterium]